MPIVRSYVNGFEVVDRTDNLLEIPNSWNLFDALNLFREESVTGPSLILEKITTSGGLLLDTYRGVRNVQNKDDSREMRSFVIPHFTLDDYITPEDVQGKRAYGSEGIETVDAVRVRKMERIRRNHDWTREVARAQLITAGTVYAPNGTVGAQNFFTEFSITQKSVDFALGTAGTDVRGKVEEVIAHIQDNVLNAGVYTNIVAICSPAWFKKLINHATVVDAYSQYASESEPLRKRLGASGLDGRFRSFDHAGILFIEYRGSLGGTTLIPDGEARAFPIGVSDLFETYYAPANKLDLVNTLGEKMYWFEYADPYGENHKIQTETNFINVLRRPNAVVKLTTSN